MGCLAKWCRWCSSRGPPHMASLLRSGALRSQWAGAPFPVGGNNQGVEILRITSTIMFSVRPEGPQRLYFCIYQCSLHIFFPRQSGISSCLCCLLFVYVSSNGLSLSVLSIGTACEGAHWPPPGPRQGGASCRLWVKMKDAVLRGAGRGGGEMAAINPVIYN